MNLKNVVLDFTQNKSQDEQEKAIMPASLAKKLLKEYADKLEHTTADEIVAQHEEELAQIRRTTNDTTKIVPLAVQCSQDFVNERILIQNIISGNWDAYKVEQTNTNGAPVMASPLVH